jgi:alkylation response protein AidB-like acyl-CoA dehydrogenase
MTLILDRPSTTAAERELREDLVARAAALVPLLKRNAAKTEQDRRVAEENIAAFEEAGLFTITQPKRYGGLAFYETQADAPTVQLAVAKAASMIDVAEMLAYRAAADVDEAARLGVFPAYAARARVRMDTAQSIVNAREAIRELVSAYGASAFAETETNPLQRIWRDSEVASRHAIANPAIGAEVYGRALLGHTGGVTPLL